MAGKPVLAAGLIVFRRMSGGLQYLMLKASYGDFHWSPPKGHVDPGETEMEAALRETQEEAGLSANQITLVENFKADIHYEVRGRPKRVVYWLAEMKDPNTAVKVSSEHTDFKWLEITEAMKYAKYENTRQAMNDADVFIRKAAES